MANIVSVAGYFINLDHVTMAYRAKSGVYIFWDYGYIYHSSNNGGYTDGSKAYSKFEGKDAETIISWFEHQYPAEVIPGDAKGSWEQEG